MENLMRIKRSRITAVVLGAALTWSLAAPLHGQAARTFKTRLSPVPIDLTMMATIAGSGSVTAVLTGNKLAVTGAFDGLRSPATVAHIHKSAVTGVPGPTVFDLTVSPATTGSIGGTVTLTPAQVTDLEKGRLYVQLASEKAPDGNLRGWLMSSEGRK
jgi:CHRD domain